MAAATSLLLAACSNNNRPPWEQGASSSARNRPPAGTTATNAAPRLAPPLPSTGQAAATPGRTSAAAPGRSTVERVTLPPPGASAAAGAAAGKQANAAAASSSPTAVAPAGAPRLAAPAITAPAGAAGKQVAAATPGIAATTPAGRTAPAAGKSPGAESKSTPIDPAWIGYETVTTKYEDTLIEIAVAHNLGFLELAIANRGVDPWLPGEGTTIVLPNMHLPPDAAPQGLVLNLPEQRLYYYDKGKLIRSYPIGIGRDGHATPVGSTTVVRKVVNPTWYPTPSARSDDPTLPAAMPAGPDNPLGTRAMYLGWGSYLIHGTNKEFGIGRRASRGCIRMYTPDVESLYQKIPVGTKVTAVDQPVKVGWIADELYVEASPTMDQVRQWEDSGKFDAVDPASAKQRVLKAAGASADRIDWSAFDRAVSERRGIPTRVTRPSTPALATAAPKPSSPAGVKSAANAPGESSGLVDWLRNRLGGEH